MLERYIVYRFTTPKQNRGKRAGERASELRKLLIGCKEKERTRDDERKASKSRLRPRGESLESPFAVGVDGPLFDADRESQLESKEKRRGREERRR